MGKPAARVGDSTVHGGVITGPGAPMVLIGGMPAARVGDNHVCPMLNPGTPPPPHVGGPIMPPGAPMVLIGGAPAACVGDMVTCSGPPDTIAPPGCPTVMIGGGGGGGGGAGSSDSATVTSSGGKEPEGHFLDVSFEDKGGKPIAGVGYRIKTPDNQTIEGTLAGRIKKSGVAEGTHEISLIAITKAAWSTSKAKAGDKVKLQVETAGIDAGEKASLQIFVRDANFADRLLTTIDSSVSGDKIEEEWTLAVDKKLLEIQADKEEVNRFSSPSYYFVVKVGSLASRSGLLEVVDDLEIKIVDENGSPVKNRKFKLFLANGEVREGTLDGNGTAQVKDVPPGQVRISVAVRQ